jgi:iron complex outermembrane receptor protein
MGMTVCAVAVVLCASVARGDDTGPQPTAQLEVITITAAKVRLLEQFTPTGSRLGLNEQELPASLDVIDNDEMIGRGLFNVQEAADSVSVISRPSSLGNKTD